MKGQRSRRTDSNGFIIALCLTSLLAGCDSGGGNDSGDGQRRPLIGAVNAVSDMGAITFLREEEEWVSLEFGSTTDFRSVDADQYDLNFDALLPGDETTICTGDDDGDDVKDDSECTRLSTVSINAIADHEYVVALVGTYANREIRVYDKAVHEFDTKDQSEDGDPEDTNLEVQFFHFASSLAAVDVYIEPPGTNLSPVQARGTLAAREAFDALVENGQYVITLTAVADPSTVYFTSDTLALDSQTRVAFAIYDGAGDGTSAIKITEFRDRGATLVDRNLSAQLRVAHAAPEAGRLDTFVGSDFSAPYFANLEFAKSSAYRAVGATELLGLDLDVMPAGNPFVFLTRKEIDLAKGDRSTFFILGSSASVDGLKSSDNVRRLATHAQLRLVNGATRTLDFYVAEHAKNNISTLGATAVLGPRASTGFQRFDPGQYDIVLTRTGTKTVAYGPYVADLAGGGIYTIVSADTGESTAARTVLFDDFQAP
jgi:uncharacterized protein DUF4397